jgi:hypothetical protein
MVVEMVVDGLFWPERRIGMRLASILAFGVLAGCTSNVTVPVAPGGMTEVTPPGTAMTSTSGVDGGLPQTATPLNDDRLNLTLYTIEQQKIDAAIAERELENARAHELRPVRVSRRRAAGVPVGRRSGDGSLRARS